MTTAPVETVAPTTTAPTTTTTALVTDATTADPKALAAQLQTVLDRYQALYEASRTDPERPFTDEKLIADFREVAQQSELASLLQIWQAIWKDGSAVRPGPSGGSRAFLTAIQSVERHVVQTTFCIYDDAVTYAVASGEVLGDSTVVKHGVVTFSNEGQAWKIARMEPVDSVDVLAVSPNPCMTERIS